MEIRPEILAKLLSESDERLWETIRKIAVMNNIALPLTPPSHEEMEKLRGCLKNGTFGYDEAMQVLSEHRQGETE